MSDYEEIDEEIKAKYGKQRKLGISVTVDSETMKREIAKNIKLEEQLESITTERDNLTSKLTILAEKEFERKKKNLNAPDSIKTIDELREWESENRPDPVGLGGSGNLSLEGNLKASGKLKEGFDSVESMIDYLHETKNKPVLDKLWEKQTSALKSGDLPNVVYDENEPQYKDEPSIIMKAIERQNEQLRRKMLERKGDK
jgi:hypothetical protein